MNNVMNAFYNASWPRLNKSINDKTVQQGKGTDKGKIDHDLTTVKSEINARETRVRHDTIMTPKNKPTNQKTLLQVQQKQWLFGRFYSLLHSGTIRARPWA